MKRFDTLLFGNGLTIALFNKFKQVTDVEQFNDFFIHFLNSNLLNKQAFHRILLSNKNSDIYLEPNEIIAVEEFLISNLTDIINNGFEFWIGEKCFNPTLLIKNSALYYFALFNYWYNLNENIFKSTTIQATIKDCVERFKKIGIKEFYTLNYDSFLESHINVCHTHGKFLSDFNDLQQLSSYRYLNEITNKIEFVYPFCIGTNGLEKINYLTQLNSKKISNYEYDFLFSNEKKYGNLLIFGIRFADTLLIPDEIKNKYTDDILKLIKYVDGHIMLRLDTMYHSKQIKTITICYYNESDLNRYKKIFASSDCVSIIEYVKCSEIYG